MEREREAKRDMMNRRERRVEIEWRRVIRSDASRWSAALLYGAELIRRVAQRRRIDGPSVHSLPLLSLFGARDFYGQG